MSSPCRLKSTLAHSSSSAQFPNAFAFYFLDCCFRFSFLFRFMLFMFQHDRVYRKKQNRPTLTIVKFQIFIFSFQIAVLDLIEEDVFEIYICNAEKY